MAFFSSSILTQGYPREVSHVHQSIEPTTQLDLNP
jgi:hypothetical protein